MASYLLLRDNKQKGPFSLDDLVELGLKPYDLVWVEGRSAAWRYPSEIAELKSFAPTVEEQPYDRFFKKNEQKEQTVEVSQTKEKSNESSTIPAIEKTKTEKKIYVSFPGSSSGKTPARETPRQPEVVKPVEKQKVVEQKPIAEEYSTPVSDEYKKYAGDHSYSSRKETHDDYADAEDKVVRLEKRFSQPLDEIKDMYVQTLIDRKKQIAKKRTLVGTLKKSSITIYVLALGILIGLTLNGLDFGSDEKASVISPNDAVVKDAGVIQENSSGSGSEEPPIDLTLEGGNENSKKDEIILLNNEEESTPSRNADNTSTARNEKRAAKKNTTPVEEDPLLEEDLATTPNTNPVNGERQKAVRGNTTETTSEESQAAVASNIRKQVTVKSNNYKKGTFGGIFDLQLTVNNETGYILDEVVVEVQYLKPSEQTLKTETIRFKSVPPNGTSTMSVPPSNRGIKVSYHITNIKYKDSAPDTAFH